MKFDLTPEQVSLLLDALRSLQSDCAYESKATNDPEIWGSNDAAIAAADGLMEFLQAPPSKTPDLVFAYAVSSMRSYDGTEVYFGTDGVFATEKEAEAYIKKDIDTTYEDAKAEDLEVFSPDYDNFCIDGTDCLYKWAIDPVIVDRHALSLSATYVRDLGA